MDREQAAVTAALEDYRARWSELVSLTVEINRWRSLYIAALIGGTAWAIGAEDTVSAIAGERPELLFALSVFNAYFAVSQAWKSWAVHQIALYCYELPGLRVTRMTDFPFAVWDEWRRGAPGAPGLDAMRRQFGRIEVVITILVSAGLLSVGLFYASLPAAAWAGVALPVQAWMLVYVIKAPLRSEALWNDSISRRCALEGRDWRYGALPETTSEQLAARQQQSAIGLGDIDSAPR